MAGLFQFNETEILAFFLVLLRMSAFIVSWPIFGSASVPAPIKILFALAITAALFPVIQWHQVEVDLGSTQLIFMSVREAFIGLCIGYLARMFLFAMSISGQVMSVSMGLSGAQLFNPSTGENASSLDQFQIFIVSLLFLAINGHHLFLSALFSSFKIVPLSANLISLGFFDSMGGVVQDITEIGIKLASPVMVAVMLMNIVMGIIGRAVPQINVLITSMPVNILVGFLVLIVSLPMIMGQVEGLLGYSTEQMFRFLKAF